MQPVFRIAFAALALAGAAGIAHGQGTVAFAAKDVHLRAGPGRDYPIVAVLPAGFQLAVQGCLPNYTWCDVLAGGSRGWVYAGNISYSYQGTVVPLLNYGPVIGIGVLGFVLGDYWNDHYRGRPWYPERDRWAHRPRVRPAPPPHFTPPRDLRPEHPRLPQPAQPIGPRPPHAGPGIAPRGPSLREPGRERGVRHEGQRRDGERRDERRGDRQR